MEFWAKVNRDGPDAGRGLGGCWLWPGRPDPGGYGRYRAMGEQYAHRVAYTLVVGAIPPGLDLDHLCRVRHCVNPAHLEPVTHRENMLRGDNPIARNAAKTHCKRGHALTADNTRITPRGKRVCRTCHREDERKRARARRAAQPDRSNAAKTHCPHGHPYDDENTYYTRTGRRSCRACGRAACALYAKERKERA